MDIQKLLPVKWQEKEIVTRIGLMSDTHMPERLAELPNTLVQIFADVDFILHAGDVGRLWVLDRLSAIAPIIAVHGNDETAEATRELPYKQIVIVAGQRILLWHSHYVDRVDELASRKDGTFLPKFERIAEHGRRAGANIVVFGHWHIPLIYHFDDICLINPGAFGSGNWFSRPLRPTVALLLFFADGTYTTVHVDVQEPEKIFAAETDFAADFAAVFARYQRSIITPSLEAQLAPFFAHEFVDKQAVVNVILRLGHRCWTGEIDVYGREVLLAELLADAKVEAADKVWAQKLLGQRR